MHDVLSRLIRYAIMGLAVAFCSIVLVRRKYMDWKEIAILSATSASAFIVIDSFLPSVSAGFNQGLGFGIAAQLVGFPR